MVQLTIVMRGMDRSEALDKRIRQDADKLEHFHSRVTSCRVEVEEIGKHHRQGREFSVKVEVRIPGHDDIVATRKHDEDVYVALRDAFDATRRQLEDAVREARGDVKLLHTR